MAKMSEERLLSMLQMLENDAGQYVTGPLRLWRDRAVKEYFQRPYGNEDPGWSSIVTGDVADTIEWLLPDLLDYFVSNDQAVVFEPTRASEADGAKQATDAANHVFYQENNGFMILYTAFKDALMVKNCAVHWFVDTKRQKRVKPFRDASPAEVQMMLDEYKEDDEAEVEYATPGKRPMLHPALGIPVHNSAGEPLMETVYTGRIKWIEQKKRISVEPFEPENLLVYRQWTSPLLDDCPYVARVMEITSSELTQLAEAMGKGFKKIDADKLKASAAPTGAFDEMERRDRTGDATTAVGPENRSNVETDDPSQTMGWLRIEYVLADYDGDGIAERRCIYRLEDEILYNEECEEVPICTGSPLLVQHRWDGQSVAELVSDIQLLNTELTRGVVNNAFSANNPRKVIKTDKKWAPYVDTDDLVDGRPGGLIKTQDMDALRMEPVAFVGNQMEPLLERVDSMRERRTGVTKQRMGLDANALRTDRTLGETQIIDSASKQRVKLIGRIFAETIVKPIFRGILRLLTSGDFDMLYFRLRGEFVEYNPNDWSDGYDMRANVGLGTGDRDQQIAVLRATYGTQLQLAQSPLGPMMVTPKQIYTTLERMLDIGGFKAPGDFYTDPKEAKMPTPPPPPPPPQILAKQMEIAADKEKLAATHAFELQKHRITVEGERQRARDQDEVQAANDERDYQRELAKADMDERIKAAEVMLQRYKVDKDNATRILTARIAHPEGAMPEGWDIDPTTGEAFEQPDKLGAIMDGLEAIFAQQEEQAAAPVEIIRDAAGNIIGGRKSGREHRVVRDAAGNIIGLE